MQTRRDVYCWVLGVFMNDVSDCMIDDSNETSECQRCVDAAKDYAELGKIVDDLVYLTKRLVQELRKSNKNNRLCDSAMAYLKRRNWQRSI